MVNVFEIKLLFKEFETQAKIEEVIDPVHKKWDEIDNNDIRDLEEKILNVCPEYDEDDLEDLKDDFVDGKFEQESYQEIKSIKSYNYRIYKICKRKIKRILRNKEQCKFTTEEINNIIDTLTGLCEEYILDKGKTYKIPYRDKDMIRKTILILFQECYLALDKVGVVNE